MTYTAESKWILQRHTVSSGRNGVPCHRWRWVSVDTGEVYETTTDSTMRNWSRAGWRELSQDTRPWGVYENVRPTSRRQTNQGIPVASADYTARRIQSLTEQEAQWCVREIQQPSPDLGAVFEVEQ